MKDLLSFDYIEMITAVSLNGAIGKGNTIPWYSKRDFSWFKHQTLNKNILMGRRTWESIGSKPLKSRRNIILSSSMEAGEFEGFEVYNKIEDIPHKKLIVIGGTEIYRQFLPFTKQLFMTIVSKNIEGANAFFPMSSMNFKNFEVIDFGRDIPSEDEVEFRRYF